MATREIQLSDIFRPAEVEEGGRWRAAQRWLGAHWAPAEGWLTFGVLLLSLLALVESVEQARWVATPSLALVVFAAAAAGLALAKTPAPSLPLHVAAHLLGGGMVIVMAASLTEGATLAAQLRSLELRLTRWWEALVGSGISTDTLPFVVILLALSWLVAYWCSWSVFRHRNLWGGLLPSGVAMVVHLTYLPDAFSFYLFLYLLAALLLASRLFTLQRERRWDQEQIARSGLLRYSTLFDALWFGLVVLLVTVALPGYSQGLPYLKDAWLQVRAPVERVEQEFNRLFGSLPARVPLPYRAFGAALPFQGAITLSDDPVLLISSSHLTNWRAKSYPVYTSQGWLMGETEKIAIPAPLEGETAPVAEPEYRAQQSLTQRVEVAFPGGTLFLGGQVTSVDRGARVEVASPLEYRVELPADQGSLPEQVAAAVAQLPNQGEARFVPDGIFFPQQVGRLFPEGVSLVSWETSASPEATGEIEVSAVVLAWQPREGNEVLQLVSDRRLRSGDEYTIVSDISVATEEELRQAGEDYPAWVRERYMQLPDTLPQRVRELAQAITQGAGTSYNKVKRVQRYLRDFEYTQTIPAPPYNADGVDYFLFELGRGYSDYFASSMAVLLRAAGVPTRLAVGYGPGEWDAETERIIVRDRDSHAWPEVYFSDYGWIPFEATPGRDAEPISAVPVPGGEVEGPFVDGNSAADGFIDDSEEEFALGGGSGIGAARLGGISWPVWAAVALVTWSVLLGGGALWWRRWTRSLEMAPRAYARMSLLAALGGVSQRASATPYEHQRELARAVPGHQAQVDAVVAAYVRHRYGGLPLTMQEAQHLEWSWRRLRWPLMKRIFRWRW